MAARPIWDEVEVLPDKKWRCPFCRKQFTGNASRVRAHLGGLRVRPTGGRYGIGVCMVIPAAERARILEAYSEPVAEPGEPSTDAADSISTGAPTATAPATGTPSATAPTVASAPATATASASASATATRTPSVSTPHGSTASTAAPTPLPSPSDLHGPSTSSASAPAPMPPPPDPHRPSASSHPSTSRGTRQMSMPGSFREGQHREATRTIAQMFYDLNLPFIMASSRIFREAVSKVAVCGPGYTPPTADALRGPLLQDRVASVRERLAALHEAWDRYGCSIMADGWTDRRRRPLINVIVSSCYGSMFLRSIDASEAGRVHSAEYIYGIIRAAIEEVGPQRVVQVQFFFISCLVIYCLMLIQKFCVVFD